MSGLAPNATSIRRLERTVDPAYAIWSHPEYQYWLPEWQKIRDAIVGQKEIKRKGAIYLSAMKGMDKDDYETYLERALFYNMTAQTLNGMLGQVFRKLPVVRNLPRGAQDKPSPYLTALQKFTKDGAGHEAFAKTCVTQQIAVGRFGALVDAPVVPTLVPSSFVVGYVAEDILDWDVEEINGLFQVSHVLVREFMRQDAFTIRYGQQAGHALAASPMPLGGRGRTTGKNARGPDPTSTKADVRADANRSSDQYYPDWNRIFQRSSKNLNYRVIYRKLTLEPHPDYPEFERVYVQRVFLDAPDGGPYTETVPVIRGVPFTFIPFKIFGAMSNSFDVEQPPLSGIVDINLSHYRTYAELEYGRTYTALPVYYAPGGKDNSVSEYHIGPNTVWEVPEGQAPGILEFKGEGLKGLEGALIAKEQQIAAIGGRLMAGMSRSTSESDNQTKLREANEHSLLLNVLQNCEAGFADLVRWWLLFRDVPLAESQNLIYEINLDFLSAPIGARELRAMQLMWENGVVGDDVMYEFLRKAAYIPSSMTFEDFQRSKRDPNNFLNNPDVIARQAGFSDRKQQIEAEKNALDEELRRMELDQEERRVRIDEEKLRIAAAADSTSISATRKLGDHEQAPASKAEIAQVGVQKDAVAVQAQSVKNQAAAAKVAAKTKPKPPAKKGP